MGNKLKILIAGTFFLVMAVSIVSGISFKTETYALIGTGSLMESPAYFLGNIISGTLSPGTFWIRFDDSTWPMDDPGTSNNERWDYIFSHYFTYDATPDNEGWDGKFPPVGSGEPNPTWRFYTAAGDTLGGNCAGFLITIRDVNGNGILETSEYESKVISSNIIAWINYSGGCFNTWCGQGSFSGTLDVVNAETWEEELYVPSATSASGLLNLRDDGCSVGVEPATWGKIKSIYED